MHAYEEDIENVFVGHIEKQLKSVFSNKDVKDDEVNVNVNIMDSNISRQNLDILCTDFFIGELKHRQINKEKLLSKQKYCVLLAGASLFFAFIPIIILMLNSKRKTGRYGSFFFRNDTIGFQTSENTKNCDILSKYFTNYRRRNRIISMP